MPRLVPQSTTLSSSSLLERARNSLLSPQGPVPHFRVGSQQLYFPKARLILLRPNAKHTPFQAKFIVPKSFNKLDLRDYLYHVYGLAALNVTTQLLHGRYTRLGEHVGRFRSGQIKKMTIEMREPFFWPAEPKAGENDHWNPGLVRDMEKFRQEQTQKIGSDRRKPTRAFGGVLGDYGDGAQPFIPRMLHNEMRNRMTREERAFQREQQLKTIAKYV